MARGTMGSFNFYESLADLRVKVLFLARQAKEEKQTATAKKLESEAKLIRECIDSFRQAQHREWKSGTQTIMKEIKRAQAALDQLIQAETKSAKKWATATKILSGLSNAIQIGRKVI